MAYIDFQLKHEVVKLKRAIVKVISPHNIAARIIIIIIVIITLSSSTCLSPGFDSSLLKWFSLACWQLPLHPLGGQH